MLINVLSDHKQGIVSLPAVRGVSAPGVSRVILGGVSTLSPEGMRG